MPAAATLSALGIAEIAAKALAAGSASGTTSFGPVTVDRLGSDGSAVLIAEFGANRTKSKPPKPLPKHRAGRPDGANAGRGSQHAGAASCPRAWTR